MGFSPPRLLNVDHRSQTLRQKGCLSRGGNRRKSGSRPLIPAVKIGKSDFH